jgi:hypothetical protein
MFASPSRFTKDFFQILNHRPRIGYNPRDTTVNDARPDISPSPPASVSGDNSQPAPAIRSSTRHNPPKAEQFDEPPSAESDCIPSQIVNSLEIRRPSTTRRSSTDRGESRHHHRPMKLSHHKARTTQHHRLHFAPANTRATATPAKFGHTTPASRSTGFPSKNTSLRQFQRNT